MRAWGVAAWGRRRRRPPQRSPAYRRLSVGPCPRRRGAPGARRWLPSGACRARWGRARRGCDPRWMP